MTTRSELGNFRGSFVQSNHSPLWGPAASQDSKVLSEDSLPNLVFLQGVVKKEKSDWQREVAGSCQVFPLTAVQTLVRKDLAPS